MSIGRDIGKAISLFFRHAEADRSEEIIDEVEANISPPACPYCRGNLQILNERRQLVPCVCVRKDVIR